MMGRPKKPEGEARTNTLRIRLTPAERAALDAAALARGQEVSTWARGELLRLAAKPHLRGRRRGR